jgi:hypothetical protein
MRYFYCIARFGGIAMKLRDVNFNEIQVPGLSIFIGEKEVAFGFIGDVLRQIPHLADCEIKSTNYYADCFVIRL